MKKLFALLLVCILNLSNISASELEDFFEFTKNQDFDAAYLVASNFKDPELKHLLLSLVQLLINNTNDSKLIEIKDYDSEQVQFLKHLIFDFTNMPN